MPLCKQRSFVAVHLVLGELLQWEMHDSTWPPASIVLQILGCQVMDERVPGMDSFLGQMFREGGLEPWQGVSIRL